MRTTPRKPWALAAAALLGVMFSGAALAGNFTDRYSAGLSSYNIKGTEPSDGAKHPVFIYTVGTTESWDNGQAMAAVAEMAAKGFVAAAVEYDSALFGTCSQILSKARYIYNSASTSSAISKLCARASADCANKGIVTAGFSQGSVIAINAKNYDTRVRAAYGMGSHDLYTIYVMTSCMKAGNYKLPTTNVRIVNGENDIFPGGTTTTVRSSSQTVAGKTCRNAFECLNANGSGWVMVKNSQVGDLGADHCYQRAAGGCVGLQDVLDSGWRNGSASWSLKTNLNWLAGFATP
jgi:hypothetical protein